LHTFNPLFFKGGKEKLYAYVLTLFNNLLLVVNAEVLFNNNMQNILYHLFFFKEGNIDIDKDKQHIYYIGELSKNEDKDSVKEIKKTREIEDKVDLKSELDSDKVQFRVEDKIKNLDNSALSLIMDPSLLDSESELQLSSFENSESEEANLNKFEVNADKIISKSDKINDLESDKSTLIYEWKYYGSAQLQHVEA